MMRSKHGQLFITLKNEGFSKSEVQNPLIINQVRNFDQTGVIFFSLFFEKKKDLVFSNHNPVCVGPT